MTYMAERWKMTVLLAFLVLAAGLACVGTLRAQIKESEVDFEVLAKVVTAEGQNCCLWNMASKYYGDPYEWTFLKEVNKIPNERRISKGTVIYIPKKPLKKVGQVSEVDELKKEISLLKKKGEECANKLKECEDEKAKLAKALEECKSKGAAPGRKALKECEAKNKKLMEDLRKLEAENHRLGADLEEMEAKNRRLARAAKDKDAEIEELEAHMRRMRRRAEECEEELARRDRRIGELESDLKKCHDELAKLEEECRGLRRHGKLPCEEEKPCKEPPKMHYKPGPVNQRSLIAAVAIAIVGSIIWIASD